jgi:hypothetical protein
MPITTSLIRLTLNCASHGDNFHDPLNKCEACKFLIHYNQQMLVKQREIDELNKQLEEFLKTNKVVAASVGESFMRGKL